MRSFPSIQKISESEKSSRQTPSFKMEWAIFQEIFLILFFSFFNLNSYVFVRYKFTHIEIPPIKSLFILESFFRILLSLYLAHAS